MKNSFTKHFYDPYDSLDMVWKDKIQKGCLSISDAAALSGYSRQYIYKLLKKGSIPSKRDIEGHYSIKWKHFVNWYSSLPTTPSSPIGYESFSLNELIRYTGMGRCWVLKFVARNNIPSYYVGRFRRFSKKPCQLSWSHEKLYRKSWLTFEESIVFSNLSSKTIYFAIAEHRIEIKGCGVNRVYSKPDIVALMRKEVKYV